MREGGNKSLPVTSSRASTAPQAGWEELQVPRQPNTGWKTQRSKMRRGKKIEKCSFNYFIPYLIISFPTLKDSLPWRDDTEEQEALAPFSY